MAVQACCRPCVRTFVRNVATPLRVGVPRTSNRSRANMVVRAGFGEDLINSISVAVKNSPINAGKKALAISQAGNYNEAATQAKIDAYIADNKVVVFSWTGCPFCKKAKALLSEVGAQYTPVELDLMGQEGKEIRAQLAKMTDRTSVPNIWIKGQNVGGCSDGPGVVTLQSQGKLVPMLKAAGAM